MQGDVEDQFIHVAQYQVGERKFVAAGADLDIKSKNLRRAQGRAQEGQTEVQTNQKQIRVLEDFLSKNPGVYDWKVHNELRHLYGGINPRKAMVHSDIILGHSPMDDYVLQILSGWQINKDTATARANLLMQMQSYPDLKFVNAACAIKVGDLYAAEGNQKTAKEYYEKVVADKAPEIAQYRLLAEARR